MTVTVRPTARTGSNVSPTILVAETEMAEEAEAEAGATMAGAMWAEDAGSTVAFTAP
jgi:hypothetical protein